MMKVLVFGHSYVKHLRELGKWDRDLILQGNKVEHFEFLFMSHPGKDYKFFLENPQEIESIKSVDPDVIIVILGGNSITVQNSNSVINGWALEFYSLLKEVIRPECLRLAVQVEQRFVKPDNPFGTPEAEEFNRRRAILNNFLNKKVKKQKLLDNVIMLGSVNYLNDPKYYTDGVHLNREGLIKYRQAMLGGLEYALGEGVI